MIKPINNWHKLRIQLQTKEEQFRIRRVVLACGTVELRKGIKERTKIVTNVIYTQERSRATLVDR